MKKFLEVLRNPVMTIFLWLLGVACEAGLVLQAVKAKGAPAWACFIMLIIDAICLCLRYKK
jgi:hypothetical protein